MAQGPNSFPESKVTAALSFFQQVKDRFVSDPAIYDKFLCLFTGNSPDPSKVTADAHALLRGHPDLVRRFDAVFPEPARQDPAPMAK